MKSLTIAVAATLTLLIGTWTAAIAHDSAQGPHGGQVVEAKGHHVEFTTNGNEIGIYLSNELHADIPTKGASGHAVILEGNKPSNVPLAPADPNVLSAKLAAPLAAGARVVISVKLLDGHDILARFVVK